MKRIICLLLTLALTVGLAFAFISCGDDSCQHVDSDNDGKCDNCGNSIGGDDNCQHVDNDNNGKCDNCGNSIGSEEPAPSEHAALEPFKAAIEASAPTALKVAISMDTGAIFGETMDAEYNVSIDNEGAATVTYWYEQLSKIEENGVTEIMTSYSGSASIAKDGTVTGDLNDKVISAIHLSIDLDPTAMTYSAASGTLTVNVAKENTKKVIGADIASDVKLTITVANEHVVSMTMTYTVSISVSESVSYSCPVTVVCTYTNN